MQNAHPGVKLLSDRGDRRPCNGTASHREREGGPAGGGRRKTFKVGDQIKDGPSELALPRSLTPSVRLSALGPCLKERKNGRGGRGIDRSRMERGAFSGNVTATTTPAALLARSLDGRVANETRGGCGVRRGILRMLILYRSPRPKFESMVA